MTAVAQPPYTPVIDFANPSQSLPPYGQPGCVLRAGLAGAKVLYFGTTTTFTMAVPNTPTLLGLSLYSQTVSLLTSQSAGQTIVDAVSNGLLFTIGTR